MRTKAQNLGAKASPADGMRLLENARQTLEIRMMVLPKPNEGEDLEDHFVGYTEMLKQLRRVALLTETNKKGGGEKDKDKSENVSAMNAKGKGRGKKKKKQKNAALQALQQRVDQLVAAAGTGGPAPKPGDWTCPSCQANVFASRTECFKCQTKKPQGAGKAGGGKTGGGKGKGKGKGGGDKGKGKGKSGKSGGKPGTQVLDKSKTPCRFYRLGTCTKGSACDWLHEEPGGVKAEW